MIQRTHRSMLGKEVDMVALMSKHETQPAVGNAKMNARGDELGPGGKVVKTREESSSAYYESNPNAIPQHTSLSPTTEQTDQQSKKAKKV